MLKVNIEEILKREQRSKYWLCQQMRISGTNLNNIINGTTSSISFRYIEEFCYFLNCTPNDLFDIKFEKSYDYEK